VLADSFDIALTSMKTDKDVRLLDPAGHGIPQEDMIILYGEREPATMASLEVKVMVDTPRACLETSHPILLPQRDG